MVLPVMKVQIGTKALDAIVLAGGESRRMGTPKAFLPWESTTMLEALLGRLTPLFRRAIVVVRDQAGWEGLGVEVLTDGRPERGPLVGLARGLAASDAPWCYVMGCDMPFLRPAVVGWMAQRLEGCDILALEEGRPVPLPAFYGRGCLAPALELLDRGETSLRALFLHCRVRTIPGASLQTLDPHLLSLRDLDTPEEYEAARRLAHSISWREDP